MRGVKGSAVKRERSECAQGLVLVASTEDCVILTGPQGQASADACLLIQAGTRLLFFFPRGFYFLIYFRECFVCMYVCTPCMYSTHRGQQRVLTLELELRTVMSHHVGAGNGIQVLAARAASARTAESSLQPLVQNFNPITQSNVQFKPSKWFISEQSR